MKNRQYEELIRAAKENLSSINIPAAAQHALLTISKDNSLVTTTFGERISIDLTDLHITPQIDMWHHLAIFQYLAAVDDAVPSQSWTGLADLPGGMVRGASFDREVDTLIANGLSKAEPDQVQAVCKAIDGVGQNGGKADLSVVFHFLPKYPMLLNLWYADDEFPASGKILINDGVKAHLGVEAAGTLATVLVRKMIDSLQG